METPKAPTDLDRTVVESLPDKPVTDVDASAVKGGGRPVKLTGGDDDLEDLEVER